MKLPSHRTARFLSALFLAALLLVPLLESGHSHNGRDLARPCAACIAAHHSPAVTAAVVAVSAPLTGTAVAVLAATEAPARRDRSPRAGRAPPASFSIVASV